MAENKINNNVILVTGSYDHSLIFWDAPSGQSIASIDYQDKFIINRIEISLDKKLLGAACTNQIQIYDVEQQKLKQSYTNNDQNQSQIYNVTAIGFQKESKWGYACQDDGQINIYDFRQQSIARHFTNKEPINTIVLHPNEVELIAGDQQGNIKIFDLTSKNEQSPVIKPQLQDDIGIRSLSMSLNGQILAAADSSGFVYIYSVQNNDSKTLHYESFIEAHSDYILKCQICPYAKKLATCSADKTIKLWNFDNKKNEKKNNEQLNQQENITLNLDKTLYGHSKWVWDCAFSCDTDFLITASSDQLAKIWKTDNGETIRTLKGHKLAINCLALNDIELNGSQE